MVEHNSDYHQSRKIIDIKGSRMADVSQLRHWIVSEYAQTYAALIDDMWIEEFRLRSAKHNLQVYHSEFSMTCMETLVLGENCMEHCGDNRFPVYVIERWNFRILSQMLVYEPIRHLQEVQCEIQEYFRSSPLLPWLTNSGRTKRHKIIHRYLGMRQPNCPLGKSFLMSATELIDSSEAEKSFDAEDSGGDYLVNSSIDNASGEEIVLESALATHTFSLFKCNSENVVEVSVSTSRSMPSHLPHCPLCMNRNSLLSTQYSPKAATIYNIRNPNETCARMPAVDSCPQIHATSAENLSAGYPKLCELKSPMLLTTSVHSNYFPHTSYSPHCDLVSFNENLVAESAASTLTKKPRSMTNHIESGQLSLESPPRKQQCFASSQASFADTKCAPSSPSVSNALRNARAGYFDNFIAQFNLLNVERELQSNSVNRLNLESCQPNNLYNSCELDKPVQCVRHGAKKREHNMQSTNGNRQADAALSDTAGHDHYSRGRRRNTNSTSSTFLPLSRHNIICFNRRTGLPLHSSPVPLKRSTSGRFDYDCSLGSGESPSRDDCPASASTTTTTETELSPEKRAQCPGNWLRRRPTSLRLTSSSSSSTTVACPHPPDRVDSVRLAVLARRHKCATGPGASSSGGEAVGSAEVVSCSAPASGARETQQTGSSWLACTPIQHSSSQHLLVNFEESMLNGRIHPVGQVDGFMLELGASGSFFPAHQRIPMQAYFFNLSDDNKPSPYLGYADLQHLQKGRGYHLPKKGSVQLTLFNPNKFVVKMFVIGYDFEDMPPDSQTFLRQRIAYMRAADDNYPPPGSAINHSSTDSSANQLEGPDSGSGVKNQVGDGTRHIHVGLPAPPSKDHPLTDNCQPHFSSTESSSLLVSLCSSTSLSSTCCSSTSSLSTSQGSSNSSQVEQMAYLRYLVQLRFHTTHSGRLYLHTDVKLIFARDKFEFDPRVATYELRSFIDIPSNPRYSPKKWVKCRLRSSATASHSRTIATP